MRSYYKLTLAILLLTLFLGAQRSTASHLAGGNITYKCLGPVSGGMQYQVTTTIYRDCNGIQLATPTLTYACGTTSHTVAMTPVDTVLVTHPCGGGLTTCQGGTLTGIQRYDFTATITLTACTDWVFSYSVAARNAVINNLTNPGGQNLGLETHNYINSTTVCNSSVVFNSDPILFVCAGQQYCFNAGATDPDGDSLSYKLVCPESSVGTCVTYVTPYGPPPAAQYNGTISIDSVSGVICMTPAAAMQQVFVFAYEVNEWRKINGVTTLVGSTHRDLQVYVTVCSNNLPSLSGIDSTTNHTLNICGGASRCFKIYATDVDASQWLTDSLEYSNTGLTISFDTTQTITTGNGTHEPVAQLCIQTTAAQIGNTYNFSIAVHDNFCPTNGTSFASYSIVVSGLTATATSVAPLCFGGNNGRATASVNGTPPFYYLWSNSQTSSVATGLSAGTYQVTVTTSSGCSAATSVTVSQGHQVTATGSSTGVSCNSGQNGTASTTLTGGTGPYHYLWSPAQQTAQTATGLSAGTYTALITDANGCSANQSVTVTQPAALSVATTNIIDPTCSTLGSFSILANGGTQAYSYFTNTNPAQSTSAVTNVAAGSYTITVRDAKGCRVNTNIILTSPTALFATLSQTDVTCNGGSDGVAGVTATGGTGNYSYRWNPNVGTTQTVTGLSAGTYSVTVDDNGGCTTSVSIAISQPTAVLASAAQTSSILCNGGTGTILVSAAGGTTPYSNTGTFTVGAGIYSYTVTDANGCTARNSITITQPTVLSASSVSGAVPCFSGSTTITVTASGGTGPYSGTGAFSRGAGNYTFTVTDSRGCLASTSISVITHTPPSVIINPDSVNIAVGDSAQLCANGATAYIWSTGKTASCIYVKSAGTYSVTGTDVYGCTASASSVVSLQTNCTCTMTYPDSSNLPRSSAAFNESEVLAAFSPGPSNCISTPFIKVWYTDEHALTLGVRQVVVITSSGTTTTNYAITPTPSSPTCVSNPLVGDTISSGDQSGNDLAVGGGRPLWPVLFITDLTVNGPNSRIGDWQQGGIGVAPTSVCGTWKGAVRTVNKTSNPAVVTITPDADPSQNNWSGIPDAPPGGFASVNNQGYAAECVWNVDSLGLITGHTYRLQVMVHDGDQNKTGGDVGESCTTITLMRSNCTGPPAALGPISGPAGICTVPSTQTYSVAAVSGATTYSWTAPANATIASGQGTTSVTVSFAGPFNGGTLSVVASNYCGNTALDTLSIIKGIPAKPGIITGSTIACSGSTQTYSIAPVSGASSYTWTVPTGASIVSGQGTNSVTVSFISTFNNGQIAVTATNACGTSAATSLNITKSIPAQPGNITGLNSVCLNSSGAYSIAPVNGATTYTWSVSATTMSVTGGQGTVSATLSFNGSFTSGMVSVTAGNGCGTSPARNLNINHNIACRTIASQPANDGNSMIAMVYPNPAHDLVNIRFTCKTTSNYHLYLIDVLGRMVMIEEGVAKQGENLIEMPLSNLPKAVYMLNLQTDDGNRITPIRLIVE